MRKQEEEQYATKLEWVKAHQFPEDIITNWHKDRKIRQTEGWIDTKRCIKCNYSTHGLHDDLLVYSTGRRKKRRMFKEKGDYLCEYCYRPLAQYYEREAIERAIAELHSIDEFRKVEKLLSTYQHPEA